MQKVRGLYLRGEVYWFASQINGERRFVSLETKDFSEAIERIAELRERPELSVSPLRSAIKKFIAYRKRQHEYTRSTVESKLYVLQEFADFAGNVTPAQVSTGLVQSYYNERRKTVTVSTANGNIMTLRAFFRWSIEVDGSCRRNPCLAVKVARFTQSARKEFCSTELRDKLINKCRREDLKFILFCGFHAGLRFNEIVEARPFWFDLKAGLLHLRKTPTIQFKDREERTIPLTKQFRAFLETYDANGPFMLQPEVSHGRSRYRYDFSLPFSRYMAKHKVPWVTPHIMRHTFASLLASAGVSIYKIAVWLGDDVRVVQRHYAKLLPNDSDIDRAF